LFKSNKATKGNLCLDFVSESINLHNTLLQERVSSRKVATRLRLKVCWCTLEARKYEKHNYYGGHDNFLLNCNIGCKKHTAHLALTALRFTQTLLQESVMSKWWLSSREKAWDFAKNKILKLVNSMKIDFLFAGLNLNIKYLNVVTWLLFSPYQNFWLRACLPQS